MIREDYLIRLIRQFAEALARVVRRRQDGQLAAAEQAASKLYDLLGIPVEIAEGVETASLAMMLGHAEKIRMAAQLAWEEGHLHQAKGDALTAFTRYRRALELFLEARAIGTSEEDDASIMELSRIVPAEHVHERYRTSGVAS